MTCINNNKGFLKNKLNKNNKKQNKSHVCQNVLTLCVPKYMACVI